MVIIGKTLEAAFAPLYQSGHLKREDFQPSSDNFPVTKVSDYITRISDSRVIRLNKAEECKKKLSGEMRRMMVFIDHLTHLNGGTFNANKFEVQFGSQPRRTDLRFSYENLAQEKIYRFFNLSDTVAELKVPKGLQENQYRYTRKIKPAGDLDCSKGKRVQYIGDLNGQGELTLLES